MDKVKLLTAVLLPILRKHKNAIIVSTASLAIAMYINSKKAGKKAKVKESKKVGVNMHFLRQMKQLLPICIPGSMIL